MVIIFFEKKNLSFHHLHEYSIGYLLSVFSQMRFRLFRINRVFNITTIRYRTMGRAGRVQTIIVVNSK